MAHFEENLIQQIKNQDQLIKTLKSRLASAEKQDENMIKILDSLKLNDKTRKTELLETRQILQDSLEKSQDLEKKTIEQIKKVERANKYADGLKLLLHEKDVMINELKYKVSLGEEAEKNKHLVDKLVMCNREKEAVYKANKILEDNLEAMNAAKLVTTNSLNCPISLLFFFQLLQDSSKLQSQQNESSIEFISMKKEIYEQDQMIVLLKEEIEGQNK